MTCTACKGSGIINWFGQAAKCPVCNGSGTQPDPGNHFVYEMGPFNVPQNAALATQSQQILDNPFKWVFAVAVSTGAFTALIRSSGTQRPFSNQQVHSSNFFGTAQNPMPLITPFVFNRKDAMLLDMTDISG